MISINTKKNSLGFVILSAANIFCKMLSLLYIPFLIATIGDEGYGIYYASYNVYAFVFMVALSGTSTVVPKLMAEFSATDHEDDVMASFKVGNKMMLGMGILMSLVLFLGAAPLSAYTGFPKGSLALIVLAPSIVFTSMNSSYRSYFQGRNNMTPIAISQVIEQVANTVFTVLFSFLLMKVSLRAGVAGGALGTTIGAVITHIYLLIAYAKDKKETRISKPRTKTDRELLIYMVKFSLPLLLSTALIYAGNNLIDVANIKGGLIKAGFDDTYSTIRYGNFGNFTQLLNVPMIIISSLSLSAFPLLAKANASKNKDELKSSVKKIFKISFLISFPAAVGLAVLSKPIFDVVFVSSKFKGSDILMIGSFIVVTQSIYQLSNTVLNSVGRVYKTTKSAAIGVIIKIICNFILIPVSFINIYGALIGLFLSQMIPFILNYNHMKSHLKIKESLIDSWKLPLVSSIIMGIVVYPLFHILNKGTSQILPSYISLCISLGISVYTGAVVYIQCLVKTKGVSEEDLDIVPRKLKKLIFLN